MVKEAKMALDTIVAGSRREPIADLDRLLAEAGLELWQAPEGFWAVRLKAPANDSTRARRTRGAK